MKKLLNQQIGLAALVLGIAAMAFFANTSSHRDAESQEVDSDQHFINTDSNISKTSTNRRAIISPSAPPSKAASQMRELLKTNIPQEKRDQLVARFEKWNVEEANEAIKEWKSLNKMDQFRLLLTYNQAYLNQWMPSQQHWKFFKECIEEYAVHDRMGELAQSCGCYNFARVLERLLLHMYQSNPDVAKGWFENIYNVDQYFNFYIFFQDNTKTLFGISTNHSIITPHPANDLPQQDMPEITAPPLQE